MTLTLSCRCGNFPTQRGSNIAELKKPWYEHINQCPEHRGINSLKEKPQ